MTTLRLPRPLLALVVVLGCVMGLRPVADMDFHWHLATGEAWLEGRLPGTDDPFTHLPTTRDSDMGSWGSDVLFALAHRLGGQRAVQLLLAATVVLLYLLAARLAHRQTRDPVSTFLFLALVASLSVHRLRARPDLLSLVALTLLLDLLMRKSSRGTVARMFLLCAVWVNLHPSVIIAPVLAAAAVPGPRWRTRLPCVAAALAGCTLSLRGPTFLFHLTRDTLDVSNMIPEWQPLWSLPLERFFDEWGLVLLVTVMFLSVIRSGVLRTGFALATFSFLVSFKSVRFLYFLVVPTLFFLETTSLSSSKTTRRVAVCLGVFLLLLFPLRERFQLARACVLSGQSVTAPVYHPQYPIAAADYLESRFLEGNLFHPVGWGGYLLWRLNPSYRTAHDGRISLYGRDVARELLDFTDTEKRPGIIDRYNLEILILPPDVLPQDEIVNTGESEDTRRRWLPIHSDGTATVYVDLLGDHWEHNRAVLRRRH